MLLVASCSKNNSSTNFKDVFLYTSIEDRSKITEIINNELFDFEYHTPIPQKRHVSSWKKKSEFTNQTEHSLIMLVSIDDGLDSLH